MYGQVSGAALAGMIVSCVVSFVLPIGLYAFYRMKMKANVMPFFVGCGVMLLFALVLESLVHRIVLFSSVGKTIQNNVYLYALYGGAMAALFEETGRLIAFKTVLKKVQHRDANALMYGAGHGGFEAAMLMGASMISNIMFSEIINSGNTASITADLSGEALTEMEGLFRTLTETPANQFYLAGVERVFAIALQISFSVLVWFAAKYPEAKKLYLLALLLHFGVDAVTVILSGNGVSPYLLEVIVGAMAVGAVVLAKRIWGRYAKPAANGAGAAAA